MQVSGTTDKELLEDLLDAVGDAASNEQAFLKPRWLSFDEGRVTVNLPSRRREEEAPALSAWIAACDLSLAAGKATARLQIASNA